MKPASFSNKLKTLPIIGWLVIFCLGAAGCDPLTDLPTSHPLVETPQTAIVPSSGASQAQETPILPARPTDTPAPADTAAPTATAAPQVVRFAVIGDYGEDNRVKKMFLSW